MKVLGFFNNKASVICLKGEEIIGFDRFSLEKAVGHGSQIIVEFGDNIPNEYDERFAPKRVELPKQILNRYITQVKRFSN